MRVARILALSAAALVSVGLLTAPPASAATSVTVDCASGQVENLTVVPGETITFDLDTASCDALLAYLNVVDQDTFAGLLLSIVDTNGTGGTVVGNFAGRFVTYTAGPRSGTDSMVFPAAASGMSARLYRGNLDLIGASYYMTVPGGGAGPAPWFQGIGRGSKDATCPATYGPSWAEWMNNGTGGWVCVREYFYDTSLADWSYRHG